MPLANHTLLQGGKYKIVRFINSGGFGCIYEAEHVMLQKRVAIKEFFVKDFCNRDEETSYVTVGTKSKEELVHKLLIKFIDEAKALCNFDHPGIVRVTDVFEENGTAYFVMKYIEGKSLNDLLKTLGPLSEPLALHYIHEVCDALEYVHDHNRLHLDIKPANIMLDSTGHAVLIDFGASKQYDEEGGENTSTLLGKTPGFAPLEQMSNVVLTFMPATDIYALGATLYKLLTGITPKDATLLANGEELEPLPSTVSATTRRAIAAAMNLKKKDRPQSVKEFVSLLKTKRPIIDHKPSVMQLYVGLILCLFTVLTIVYFSKDEFDDTPVVLQTCTGVVKDEIGEVFIGATVEIKGSTISSITDFDGMFILEGVKKGSTIQISYTGYQTQAVVWNGQPIEITLKKNPTETIVVPAITHLDHAKITNSNGLNFTYTGAVNPQKLPHGKGKGIYEDGVYEGNYVNGIREGQGKFDTQDQSNHFEGTFVNDKYKEGKLTMKEGSYYEGTFVDGKYKEGKFIMDDGSYYEGTFVDGKYKEGKLTMKDGSYYKGTFKNENFKDGEWFTKTGKKDGKMRNGKFI